MDIHQVYFLLAVTLLIQNVSPHAFVAKLQNEKETNEGEEKIHIPFDENDDEMKVEPPDHLQAMKMERDGDANKNYHKEVFLGKEVEKFQNGDLKHKEQKEKLKEIFQAVDLNLNGSLDVEELTVWVLTKTREHFYEARMNIEKTFEKLDRDKDGNLTWNEFVSHFLAAKGFDKEKIFQQLEEGEKIPVSEELTNEIQELKEKWIQVQKPGEKSLTLYQFLDFEHPETSKETLKYLVEDILHDMDSDNSKDLSVQEYVAMGPDANVDSSDDVWVIERAKEFREVIDTDHDGRVTVEELAVGCLSFWYK